MGFDCHGDVFYRSAGLAGFDNAGLYGGYHKDGADGWKYNE